MLGIYVTDNFSLSVSSIEDDTPRLYSMTVQGVGRIRFGALASKRPHSHSKHTSRATRGYLQYIGHSGNTNLQESHVDVRSERERRL